jgi:hypothetical protein
VFFIPVNNLDIVTSLDLTTVAVHVIVRTPHYIVVFSLLVTRKLMKLEPSCVVLGEVQA